jgi:hypothetical protein
VRRGPTAACHTGTERPRPRGPSAASRCARRCTTAGRPPARLRRARASPLYDVGTTRAKASPQHFVAPYTFTGHTGASQAEPDASPSRPTPPYPSTALIELTYTTRRQPDRDKTLH